MYLVFKMIFQINRPSLENFTAYFILFCPAIFLCCCFDLGLDILNLVVHVGLRIISEFWINLFLVSIHFQNYYMRHTLRQCQR